jgi:hypothetical protein
LAPPAISNDVRLQPELSGTLPLPRKAAWSTPGIRRTREKMSSMRMAARAISLSRSGEEKLTFGFSRIVSTFS